LYHGEKLTPEKKYHPACGWFLTSLRNVYKEENVSYFFLFFLIDVHAADSYLKKAMRV